MNTESFALPAPGWYHSYRVDETTATTEPLVGFLVLAHEGHAPRAIPITRSPEQGEVWCRESGDELPDLVAEALGVAEVEQTEVWTTPRRWRGDFEVTP